MLSSQQSALCTKAGLGRGRSLRRKSSVGRTADGGRRAGGTGRRSARRCVPRVEQTGRGDEKRERNGSNSLGGHCSALRAGVAGSRRFHTAAVSDCPPSRICSAADAELRTSSRLSATPTHSVRQAAPCASLSWGTAARATAATVAEPPRCHPRRSPCSSPWASPLSRVQSEDS